jgi:hypothetical protein
MAHDKKVIMADELILGNLQGQNLQLSATGLMIYEKGSRSKVLLRLMHDALPGLSLYDNNGQERLRLSVEDDGGPQIELYDGNDQIRVQMGVSSSGGTPYVQVFDATGDLRFETEMDKGNGLTPQ